jgi:hypothetical protein
MTSTPALKRYYATFHEEVGVPNGDHDLSMARIAVDASAADALIAAMSSVGIRLETALSQRDAEIAGLRALLRDCAEHFKTLREAGVFVWPNHPLNPEARIQAIIDGSEGK